MPISIDKNLSRSSTISQVLKVMSSENVKNKIESQHEALTFISNGMSFQYGIANTLEDRMQAYRLVYKNYYEKEYIDYHESKLWFTLFDAHPSTITLIIKHKELIVACVSVMQDDALGLPADDLYHEELNTARRSKLKLMEITGLAIHKNYSHNKDVVSFITNISFSVQRIFQSDTFFITVNPRHKAFYLRKFLFKQVGEEKTYSKVNGAPAVLLQLSNSQRNAEMLKPPTERSPRLLYKNYLSHKSEQNIITKLKELIWPLGCKDLFFLFHKTRPILQELKPQDRKEILGYYEKELLMKIKN